jgi:LmbE family N-acetylglucosaminyl deacetylase
MMAMRTIYEGRRRASFALLLGVLLCASHARAAPPQFGSFSRDDVLLVVAPHPDDESLCCAGALVRARAAGARVAVVWITSGDAFELDAHVVERRLLTGTQGLLELAHLRMQEAARAAELLKIPAAQRFFLGYPDRGIAHLLAEPRDLAYVSPHTGASAVPYPEAFAPGAAYTGSNLERDLKAVIERVQPTWVLAPTPLDEHEDHRATGELVLRTMGDRGQSGRVRYWIVHGGFEWPWPRGLHPQAKLTAPRVARALPWHDFELSDAERSAKADAIGVYKTQLLLTSSFMLSFVKRNEIYTAVPLMPARPAAKLPTNSAPAPDFHARQSNAVK